MEVTMAIYRMFTGSDDASHIEELKVGSAPPIAEGLPARELSFHEIAADFFNDFHAAPERSCFIILDGQMELGFRDGTKQVLNPGDATLVQDTTGSGHSLRATSATSPIVGMIRLPQ
jgi:hypothetical protein